MTFETQGIQYNLGKKTFLHPFTKSFDLGKIYALMGLNGSGKTTLLKILSGIWSETSGKILWSNQNVGALGRKERSQLMTYVPHAPPVHFDYTVRDIVKMGGFANGLINSEPQIDNALKVVGLVDLQHRPITQISAGEKQRTYLARALMTKSPILLLDEPTASLDIKQCAVIWELLSQLKEQGKLIIVATHDLTSTEKYCDEILFMKNGRCVVHDQDSIRSLEGLFDR